MLHHIWFDCSDTLAFLNKKNHNRLRYSSYAQVTGRAVDDALINEYEELYKKHSNSNAAAFRSLGKSANFWSERIHSVDPKELYTLADPSVPDILQTLKARLPISIFSNIQLEKILPALGIEPSLFTHILSAGMVKEPKPALDGFYKMIELSQLPPAEILYIGDHVEKDVRPAKRVGIKSGILWKKSVEADYSFHAFEDILRIL